MITVLVHIFYHCVYHCFSEKISTKKAKKKKARVIDEEEKGGSDNHEEDEICVEVEISEEKIMDKKLQKKGKKEKKIKLEMEKDDDEIEGTNDFDSTGSINGDEHEQGSKKRKALPKDYICKVIFLTLPYLLH